MGSVCDRWTELLQVIACMRLALVNFVLDRRFFVENRAQPLAVEPHTESVFLREPRNLSLSIFVAWRPEPCQLILVNSAVLPFVTFQFAVEQVRKRTFIHADSHTAFKRKCFAYLGFYLAKIGNSLPGEISRECDLHIAPAKPFNE